MSWREFISSLVWTAISMTIYFTILNYFYVPASTLPHISQAVLQQVQNSATYNNHIIHHSKDYIYITPNGTLENDIICENSDLWSVMQFQHDQNLKVSINYESHKDFTLTCNVEVTNLNSEATAPEECALDLTLINASKDKALASLMSKDGKLEISKSPINYNLGESTEAGELHEQGWAGIMQDHWANIVKPQHQAEYQHIQLVHKDYDGKLSGYQIRSKLLLEYNKPQTLTFVIFCGPKILQLLKSIKTVIPKVDWVIDYGYFTVIIRPFFELLSWISYYCLFSNLAYGAILFTAFSKLLCIFYFPIVGLESERGAKNIIMSAVISLVTTLIIYKLVYAAAEFKYTSLWWIKDVSATDSVSILDYISPGISSMIGLKLSITAFLVWCAASLNELLFGQGLTSSIFMVCLITFMMNLIPAIFGILYVVNTAITILEKSYIHPK